VMDNTSNAFQSGSCAPQLLKTVFLHKGVILFVFLRQGLTM
jgi:hypothetical protein